MQHPAILIPFSRDAFELQSEINHDLEDMDIIDDFINEAESAIIAEMHHDEFRYN